MTNNRNIEIKRIKAANEIRSIKQKIAQLEKEKDNYRSIYLAREINRGSDSLLISRFDKVNDEIIKLNSIYIKPTPIIRSKENERDSIAAEIRNEIYNSLQAKLKLAEAEELASERPEGVLGKYSELLRVATLDENTFLN